MEETITCDELQQLMRRFCEQNGIEVVEKSKMIECKMVSGAKFAIYHKPLRSGIYTFYGIIYRPYVKIGKVLNIDTKGAIRLKQKFNEYIKEE